MKLFRYRKPSVKTALGVTKAKKTLKRKTGITAAARPTRAVSNAKRRVKRKAGYYSTPAKALRAKKPPTPLGCLLPIIMSIVIGVMLVMK